MSEPGRQGIAGDGLSVGWGLEHPDLLVGVIVAEGINVGPSDEPLRAAIAALTEERAAAPWPPDALRVGIRRLLRLGGFKASGRSKPASEYLAAAAGRGEFPYLFNVVDINNLVSLQTGWPASVLDVDRLLPDAQGTLEVRFGRDGERYVFNGAGHSIELKGLLCLARVEGPCLANPVKDSMEAKVDEQTRRVMAVIYTSRTVTDEPTLRATCARYARLLTEHAAATACVCSLLPAGESAGASTQRQG